MESSGGVSAIVWDRCLAIWGGISVGSLSFEKPWLCHFIESEVLQGQNQQLIWHKSGSKMGFWGIGRARKSVQSRFLGRVSCRADAETHFFSPALRPCPANLVSHYSAIGDIISCDAPHSAIGFRGKFFFCSVMPPPRPVSGLR